MKKRPWNRVLMVSAAVVVLVLGVAAPADAFFRRTSQQPPKSGGGFASNPGGYGGFAFNNAPAAVTVDPATVEKYFEDYAVNFTTGLDATNGRRGASLLCGGVSYTYGAMGRLGASTFSADLSLNGFAGLGTMAVLYGDGAVQSGSGYMAGQVATFQMMSGQSLPQSADEANALWDAVFGSTCRYGYSFQAIQGGWCIKASQAGGSGSNGNVSLQGWTVMMLIVPDPEAPDKALVVHHSGWGSAATYVY